MLLKLTHTTNLSYDEPISETVMELRMAPRQEQDQHRLSFELAIGPATSAYSYFDWLGNTVHTFTVNGFHRQIRIVASSVVETDRPPRDPAAFEGTWPPAAGAFDYACYDFLQFGGPVVDSTYLRDLAKALNPVPGMPTGALALNMLRLINEKFTYRKGITTAASPITEMLEHGVGVCQDFAHLMIGLARVLGIPARYVSGMLHPEGERFKGFTQTHAWAELMIPSVGWVGFDPANNCMVGENFVRVGIGRNYSDVPPNRGLYRGKSQESMHVEVNSEPLKAVPPELAAERFQPLDVPTFPGNPSFDSQQASYQQEQQQQQQ